MKYSTCHLTTLDENENAMYMNNSRHENIYITHEISETEIHKSTDLRWVQLRMNIFVFKLSILLSL